MISKEPVDDRALPAAEADASSPEALPATAPHESRLAANIFWMYALQGLNYLIPAALLPYLVRVLGVEQYGLIAFSQATAQYFILATDYGFNFSASRTIAQNRDDVEKVSEVFWTTISIKLVLLILSAAILAAIVLLIPRFQQNAAIYFAAYVGVVGNALFPTWLFLGMERMGFISTMSGLGRLASAVLIVLLVHRPEDTLLAALLLSSGFLFAGIAGIIVALRHHVSSFKTPRRADVMTALREGRHLFFTTAAISLYTNTNTFLVGLIAGNVQAGYFSLADKLVRALIGLVSPAIQAGYPHVIRLIARSKQVALSFLRKALIGGAALGSCMGLSVLLLARPMAHLAFGKNAADVVPLLHWLAFFPLFGSLSYILGVLILIPFGFDKVQSRFLFSVGIVNVVLGCILIPRYGSLGGVFSMTGVEAVQVIGSLIILSRGGVSLFSAGQDASA